MVRRVIKNFKDYLVEETKEVYFTFGRMNPPTIGHGKVMDALKSKARGADYRVYVSQSQDAKKNPLSYSDKIKHLRKMFPSHARQVMVDKKVRTAIEALVSLYNAGYRKINMVVGEDRIREFDTLLNKYNGVKARHGFYNFENINVISAGRRDPDAEGVEGMSASKMRGFAQNNNFQDFAQGLPSKVNNKDARKLFNDVRKGMGLKEETSFKRHIELPVVSETREQFIKGELFELGDSVVIKESEEIGIVSVLGANYVIVEMSDGKKMRKWLDAVELVEKKLTPAEIKKREEIAKAIEKDNPDMPMDKKMAIATAKAKEVAEKGLWDNIRAKRARGERMRKKGEKGAPTQDQIKRAQGEQVKEKIKTRQDKDIDDKKGTQPARYHKGLAKSTKSKRDAHFKKGAKMDDDNPKAYTPAPGDKDAKTKPSKYTKSFKKMFGEDTQIEEDVSKALKKKSEKSGISAKTLRTVYNRGVAAWRTGHRPGTTPQQWGLARVNAFIVKKKKGGLNHDKDLA